MFAGCTDDIVTSDHSPVFATFEVGVTSQFVSKKGIRLQKKQKLWLSVPEGSFMVPCKGIYTSGL